MLVPRRDLFAERLNSLLDAAEQMTRTQQLVDAKPRHCLLRTDRLKARDGKIAPIGVTPADKVTQDLRRGKVDLDNARRLQDDQPRLLRRGLQGVQDISPKMIGVEKRQRRLKSRDNDAGLSLAREIRARRPPDRGSGHTFEYQHAGARRAPYAVHKRERDTDPHALFDRKDDDRR